MKAKVALSETEKGGLEKGGTGKLKSCWERKIYEVIAKQELVPVYTVRALGEKKTKTVHRNMMMKINDLPIDTFGQQQTLKKQKVRAKKERVKCNVECLISTTT